MWKSFYDPAKGEQQEYTNPFDTLQVFYCKILPLFMNLAQGLDPGPRHRFPDSNHLPVFFHLKKISGGSDFKIIAYCDPGVIYYPGWCRRHSSYPFLERGPGPDLATIGGAAK
jgi:hypothetical protein